MSGGDVNKFYQHDKPEYFCRFLLIDVSYFTLYSSSFIIELTIATETKCCNNGIF